MHDRRYRPASDRQFRLAVSRTVALPWQVDRSSDGVEIWDAERSTVTGPQTSPVDRVFDFDLNDYAPDGPDASVGHVFIEIRSTKALYLVRGGAAGLLRWSADE